MALWTVALLLVALAGLASLAAFTTRVRRHWVREVLPEIVKWATLVRAQVEDHQQAPRWISRERYEGWESTRPPTIRIARGDRLRRSPAEVDAWQFARQDLRTLVDETNDVIRASSLQRHKDFFDTIESQPLTDEQATAVVTFDNRVQVIAAAGSGKTSVMVARAAYSVMKGFVPADRILLLAFNKDAAAELQERVSNRLGSAGIKSDGLTASTFHAFGLKVIGRATRHKPRLASWLDRGGDVEMVSRIIDDLRDRSLDFRFNWDIYRLLLAGLPDEADEGEPDSYDPEKRNSGFKTFNGEVVRSHGERLIANFLYLNGVNYEYERPYAIDVADAEHSQYRPDFFYPDVDVWHEHWALDRDGNPPPTFEGYAEGVAWKRALHIQHGTKLVETTWAEILDGGGLKPLAHELMRQGLQLDWNPDRPIRDARPVAHEQLAGVMRQFMTHVKSNCLSPEDLETRLQLSKTNRYKAKVFLNLYWEIHNEWQQRLAADGSIDFEDMLVTAAEHLEAGTVDMGYDLVLVDEFQDASRARARLARALVDAPDRYVMAVGDDWQSINRFAGADLSVMTGFNEWFGQGPTLRLQTTFRSPQAIVDAASGFVAKNPRQLEKDVRSAQSWFGDPPRLIRVGNDAEVRVAVGAAIEEIAARVRCGDNSPPGGRKVSIDVLGRYGFDRDRVPRGLPPEVDVKFRTVHSSKGLEADYVIVPNMSKGTYGFPSEIVDDPVLSLAMAEAEPYPHAEERRLFYVALTRARRGVTLIGVQGQESVFLTELLKDGHLELSPLSTVEIAEPCPECGRGVLVVRRRKADGVEFEACSAFPRCTFTRSI